MKLYRLKSNPNTIVRPLGQKLVKLVWSLESGLHNTWCIYSRVKGNLIPLTKEHITQLKSAQARLDGTTLADALKRTKKA